MSLIIQSHSCFLIKEASSEGSCFLYFQSSNRRRDMKYKLKKDLPFAEAGMEIIIHPSKLPYPNMTIEVEYLFE